MRLRLLLLALLATSVRSLCAENCLAFDKSGVCMICNFGRGFYPTGNGDCFSSTIEGCATYDIDGGCAACQKGWIRNGCGCLRGDKNDCQFISGGDCLFCARGMFPEDGECVDVVTPILHCLKYSSETFCIACEEGFYAWHGKCVKGEANCLAHTGPVCSYCAEGYRLVSTIFNSYKEYAYLGPEAALLGQFPAYQFECLPVYEHCAVPSYGVDNVCRYCETGYYLAGPNDCVEIEEEVEHCLYYGSETDCIRCENYYVLVDPQTCQPAAISIPHCVSYTDVNVCGRCETGYFVESDTVCGEIPEDEIVDNCAVYDSEGACEYCATTYYLKDGACVKRPVLTANCARNALTGCIMCANDFYLDAGACKATTAVADCARYSNASTCSMCLQDFYLKDGACIPFNTISGCLIYASATTCKYCRTGMFLDKGACSAVTTAVSNCLYYASATECLQCGNNYLLSSAGDKCSIHAPNNCQVFTGKNTCSRCLIPYFYDAAKNLCVVTTAVTRCARYSSATTCEFCEYGFYLKDNACIQHPIAFTTTFDNCVRFDSDSCITCATGYYWQEDQFQCRSVPSEELVSSCAVYESKGATGTSPATRCIECTANNYLIEGTCASANSPINSCEAYDFENNCVRCALNFFLESPLSCRPVAPANQKANCLVYKSLTTCDLCVAGYFIDAGVCKALSDAPITDCLYHSDSKTCVVCAENFFLQAGKCVAVKAADQITDCLYYKSATACLECKPDFFTTDSVCIPPSVKNCKFYNSELFCDVCNDLFFQKDGYCSAVPSYIYPCFEYSSGTKCAHCSLNYFLTETFKCQSRGYGIANCRSYNDSTSCRTCETKYYFDTNSGSCVLVANPPAGCLYLSTNTLCQTCQSGFALSGDRTKCLANCEVSRTGTKCDLCINHTYNNNGNCVPVTTRVPNCRHYTNANRCFICEVTHEVNVATGACTPRPDYALYEDTHCRWAFKETCAFCDAGFYKAFAWNNYNYTPCRPVPETIVGCKIYSQNGRFCEVCDTGYFQPGYRKACAPLGPKRDCYCYAGSTYSL